MSAVLIVAQYIAQHSGNPGLRATLPWEWDTRPPCLAMADLAPRFATDHPTGPVRTSLQLDVFHTDGFLGIQAALAYARIAATFAGPYSCDDGELVSVRVSLLPQSTSPSAPGDGPGDTSVVRFTQQWEVVTSGLDG